jgi:hypothetical protein
MPERVDQATPGKNNNADRVMPRRNGFVIYTSKSLTV